jgi:hypothetical protein
MSQSVVKEVSFGSVNNLGYFCEPAECCTVQNPIAVTFEGVSLISSALLIAMPAGIAEGARHSYFAVLTAYLLEGASAHTPLFDAKSRCTEAPRLETALFDQLPVKGQRDLPMVQEVSDRLAHLFVRFLKLLDELLWAESLLRELGQNLALEWRHQEPPTLTSSSLMPAVIAARLLRLPNYAEFRNSTSAGRLHQTRPPVPFAMRGSPIPAS